MQNLIKKYNGSLNRLHDEALNPHDLEMKIRDLGKGIGSVTVSIFLRELRDLWEKANPNPTSLIVTAAENLGIIRKGVSESSLQQLKNFWSQNRIEEKSFINFETALLRLGKNFCRKRKCTVCPVKDECLRFKVP